jgi:hypothetical protein
MGTDRARRRHEIKRDGFMFYQRTFLVTGGSSYDLGLVVDKTQPTTAKALRRLYTKIQQPDLSRAFVRLARRPPRAGMAPACPRRPRESNLEFDCHRGVRYGTSQIWLKRWSGGGGNRTRARLRSPIDDHRGPSYGIVTPCNTTGLCSV